MPAGKTLLTVHDCGVLKGLGGFKFHLMKWLWFTLPARHAGWITVNSEATKRDLLSYIRYDAERIKVIHICVGAQFTAFPKSFNSTKPVILQIGTAENKNLKRIIPALQGIPCQYIIIGKLDISVKGLLAKHAIEYQSIERALSEDELLHQYQSCDILSFVSTLEGFGMPIIEANGVGRVVVTGNTSSMPEIAGNAAHLVDPLDISAIREGFLKVINDTGYRNQLIENGFRNVKRFDKKRIAEAYFGLYRRIADADRS
jgi:glycosyltransferase involved in cell wall biosynthesis